VRVPVSAFISSRPLPYPVVETPETAITDLQTWDIGDASSNVRRDLKKAQRAGVSIAESVGLELADALYGIYHDTIRRHRGSLRYTRPYFRNLLQLSRTNPRLRVSVALVEGKVGAFNVAAIDGSQSFYLHGGIDLDASSMRPGALLMDGAIRWAQQAGCESFNLMSSPADQVSLIRYKEKWGGTTRLHRTYTLKLGPSYPVFRLAESIYRRLG
jgi:lipid II:glycine glycyltransferase (peptidoglycan interpeptide bridge formation enzyme)